jgi:hypothetical protein
MLVFALLGVIGFLAETIVCHIRLRKLYETERSLLERFRRRSWNLVEWVLYGALAGAAIVAIKMFW